MRGGTTRTPAAFPRVCGWEEGPRGVAQPPNAWRLASNACTGGISRLRHPVTLSLERLLNAVAVGGPTHAHDAARFWRRRRCLQQP